MLLLFSFAAAISKRMIMSFYKFYLFVKSGMVHVNAEFVRISVFSVALWIFILKTYTER